MTPTPVRPPTPEPDEYLTTAELCRRLQICRSTVRNHGPTRYAIRVGREWRFHWGQVLAHYARPGTEPHRSTDR